jgi:hypothetical protein
VVSFVELDCHKTTSEHRTLIISPTCERRVRVRSFFEIVIAAMTPCTRSFVSKNHEYWNYILYIILLSRFCYRKYILQFLRFNITPLLVSLGSLFRPPRPNFIVFVCSSQFLRVVRRLPCAIQFRSDDYRSMRSSSRTKTDSIRSMEIR